MKYKLLTTLLLAAMAAALAPAAVATTWYVNGGTGSDSNNCTSSLTACKTIGHAISRAASGDSILVAAAVYKENLIIGKSLKIMGAKTNTTIIDGGGVGRVIAINSSSVMVTLSRLTIRNGRSNFNGGISQGAGINNFGILTIINSAVSGNRALRGGGIYNGGRLTISGSTLNGNVASGFCSSNCDRGGGIYNAGRLTISNTTLSGNGASQCIFIQCVGEGGGIFNADIGTLTISNSTLSGNSTPHVGGGLVSDGTATVQNSIVANNSGGNCAGGTSHGYNLSSDNTCNFNGPGDMNNIAPNLGTLGYHGGPTQTIPLLSGSPAIDTGNPSGCTDGQGHLLMADQRGYPRPDPEDTGGCDMGAFERQSD